MSSAQISLKLKEISEKTQFFGTPEFLWCWKNGKKEACYKVNFNDKFFTFLVFTWNVNHFTD